MKLSALSKALMLMVSLLFLISVSGVSATWYYARGDAHRQEAAPGITLSEFTWKSEEILPTTTPGENHLVVIKNILGDANVIKNAAVKKAFNIIQLVAVIVALTANILVVVAVLVASAEMLAYIGAGLILNIILAIGSLVCGIIAAKSAK